MVEADITSLDFSRAMTVALDWRGKNGAAVPGRVIDIHHGFTSMCGTKKLGYENGTDMDIEGEL